MYRKLTTFQCPNRGSRRLARVKSARTIESFTEAECWQRFRTRKEDLPKLLVAFKLSADDGEFLTANNGSIFTKEEILLIGLHRYCVPGPLAQTMSFNLFPDALVKLDETLV